MVRLSKFNRFKKKRDGVQLFIDICTFCGYEYNDVDFETSSYWCSRFSTVSDYDLVDSILTCYQSILSIDSNRFFDKFDISKIYF